MRHFRTIMREVRAAARGKPDEDIIASARRLLGSVGEGSVPDFVAQRLTQLEIMIGMLGDAEWQIPARERGRVLNALAYFAEPHDLIPDHIPALGFLDDAIMIELVVRELRHEIEAYNDFCVFRRELKQRRQAPAAATPDQDDRLASRRKALHERMRRRDNRQRTGNGSSDPGFTLF